MAKKRTVKPKPCVLCKRLLEPATPYGWKTLQPYVGGEIRLLFGFGSTKFDEYCNGTEYRGLICDDCAEKIVGKMKKIGHD